MDERRKKSHHQIKERGGQDGHFTIVGRGLDIFLIYVLINVPKQGAMIVLANMGLGYITKTSQILEVELSASFHS